LVGSDCHNGVVWVYMFIEVSSKGRNCRVLYVRPVPTGMKQCRSLTPVDKGKLPDSVSLRETKRVRRKDGKRIRLLKGETIDVKLTCLEQGGDPPFRQKVGTNWCGFSVDDTDWVSRIRDRGAKGFRK